MVKNREVEAAIPRQQDSWINTLKLLNVHIEQQKRSTQVKAGLAALINMIADLEGYIGTGLDWTILDTHEAAAWIDATNEFTLNFCFANTAESNNNWPSKVRYCQLMAVV